MKTTDKTMPTEHTPEQIAAWHAYEKVRKGGRFNMFDPRARRLTGLSADMYSYVMQHYSTLKAQIGESGA